MSLRDKELEKTLLERFGDDDEDTALEVVHSGEWEQDMKYQTREIVVFYEGRHYSFIQTRSGSYHSDWEYQDTEVYEVRPVQTVITTWEEVK